MSYFNFIAKADYKVLPVFLLVLAVFQGLFITYYHFANEHVLSDYEVLQNYSQLYVAPGAKPGFYDPSKPEVLLKSQAKYVLTMMNSYTPPTYLDQYKAIRTFFSPVLQIKMDGYYTRKVREVIEDEQSTKLVLDDSSYKAVQSSNENAVYNVEVEGSMQYIMAGKIVQAIPLRFKLKFNRSYINKSNPYGFLMIDYKVKQL